MNGWQIYLGFNDREIVNYFETQNNKSINTK